MNSVINDMLKKYEINNTQDEINALKEIVQEIILCGLSRGGFFDVAAFYGGTALRIFYGLDRFSEDLDFALLKKDKDFDLSKYFKYVEKEAKTYGLNMKVELKNKNKQSNVESAFMKGDTLENIIKFFPNEENKTRNQLLKEIKIKFEVDINPPEGATYEIKYKLLPSPHQIRLYDNSSLFAGKIHAVLCRNWVNRTKGRDLYDYVFYLQRNISVNLVLLKNKLIESDVLKESDDFNIDVLKSMLNKKFEQINFDAAKKDVLPFIKDASSLDIWSKDFFTNITNEFLK